MEWLGWAFAAATALLLTIFIFLYLHQKQQAQHQHKKSQKALGKLENEMNRMQKELHHERDIIGLIQEHMVEGILILDDSDKIQLANRTATALLNISKESWDNKSIFILTNNQDFLDALRKSKTAPQHELLPEDSELHKGCSVRQLLKIDGKYIRAYITRVEMGGIFGTIVLLVDVTYNVKAEKMRQEFTANVSHELKTPLTSISGFAEIMKDGLVQQEDVPQFAGKIFSESQRLIDLVGDIIKISQLDEDMLPYERQTVDLYQLCGEICERLQQRAQAKGVTLTLSGQSAQVNTVRQIADEVIYNLCDNAIKYNRPDGSVTVTVSTEAGSTKVWVQDTGIGISSADQRRVFERFYRVDKSHSRQIGGTGLGLSIVKHGAAYLGVKVGLQSQVGQGSTFWLEWSAQPLMQQESPMQKRLETAQNL